ncbi:MAG: bifunctional methylenetetrahydrofolate dehydrogenase/methenyltetrahydrofolate cyclohydrolase FolD [Bryobacteraceae bacterium]|nr:bifunctional methylenetetrahydrofolate dehydrogenase/methenyltetrahydrofolate cyclohydrolase FolD [Bryobacteraceae bacterium]
MSARILDGKRVRDEILSELKPRIAALPRPPGLAVVLVGNDPASEIYVRSKVKTSAELGLFGEKITPPASISTAELLDIVYRLNARPEIDGILVQMPLPAHIDSRAILHAVDPSKDVDGFHPINVGKLVENAPAPRPCTPNGVMELLRRAGIDPGGKRAVIVGRSDIVGKPMALLLLHANATVTICHSRTSNLAQECERADILVAALGRPAFLRRDHIRPGAVLIDVGINRVDGKVVGDIDPEAARELASAYTPVPGGVGPLTIAMLMRNTVESAERRIR